MEEPKEFIAPKWDEIYELLMELANRLKKSAFTPDCIVGISRGGWTPARVLSDFLDNPSTASMKVEFYVGIGKTAKKPVITQPLIADVSGKSVLLVDDVADSGESLKVAVEHILEKGASKVITATIYYKPRSTYRPDFYARETSAWIIFPWERLEATKLLLEMARKKGLGVDWVRKVLIGSGIDMALADKLIDLALEGV